MDQVKHIEGRQHGRLLRLGIAAVALGAWIACAPAQGTARADTPPSEPASASADAGPSAGTVEQSPDDDVTEDDPPASAANEDDPTESDETDDAAASDLDAETTDSEEEPPDTTEQQEQAEAAADEPVVLEPVVGEPDSRPDREDPPKQEPERHDAGSVEARVQAEDDTAAVVLATVETPDPVETTPTPPQPLSPTAELLEAPGRLVNAVLQVLGLTTAANVPVSPITFAPINDAIFGTFREIERQLGLWQTPAPQPVVPTMTYTGDTTRPTPTVAQFLNASAAGYVLGSTPGGLKPLSVNGFQMSSTNVFSGMVGKAWVTPEDQVIIAYQGTTGGSNLLFNPLITISQLLADLQVVFTGTTPLAFYDALGFAQRVQAEAALQGYSDEDIFVTGHSLGGWEAQFVAQRTGLAGIGFEAPGMNTRVPGNGADAMFVNIGTYGSPAPYMATDLFGLQPFMPPFVPGGGVKPHCGPIVMIGDPAAMTPLYNASQLWGRTPIGSVVFLADYLMNFFQYHLPAVQAYHLDVAPDPGIVLWVGTARGPVHTGYGTLTIPELMTAASDDGILFRP